MLRLLPAWHLSLAGAAALTLLLAACGVQSSTPSSLPSPSLAIPTVAPNLPASGSASAVPAVPTVTKFTNQNWGLATQHPDQYTGVPVDLTGQVFNVEEDSSRVGVQMWTDPLRATGNTVVIFQKQGSPAIDKDDQIEVQGTIDGVFTGKSDGGDTLTLPRIQATSVKVLQHGSPAPSAAASAPASASAAPSVAAKPSASVAAVTTTPPPSPSPSSKPLANGLYRVAGAGTNGLSVRTGPAISQTKIGVVHDGEVVLVVGQGAPGWAKVQGDGFSAYVSTAYLTGPATLASSQPLAKLSK